MKKFVIPFLLALILWASPSQASKQSSKYWQGIDSQYGDARKDLLSATQAKAKTQELLKSDKIEEQALGNIINRAKADKAFATQIQKIIASVRAQFKGDYKYPFIVDGDFAHRSISELLRLYADPKASPELVKALNDFNLPLTQATVASLQKEHLAGKTVRDGLNAVNGTSISQTDCANQMSNPGNSFTPATVTQTPDDIGASVTPIAWSPDQAIQNVLSEPLVPIGKGMMPGENQMPACVFRNSKVYVVYSNCSKNEPKAANISIFNVSGGEINLYAEVGATQTAALSTLKRNQYDDVWTVSYRASAPAPANMTLPQITQFFGDASKSNNYCLTGGTLKASASLAPSCSGTGAANLASWTSASQNFWNDPGSNWYQLLQQMRTNVSKLTN